MRVSTKNGRTREVNRLNGTARGSVVIEKHSRYFLGSSNVHGSSYGTVAFTLFNNPGNQGDLAGVGNGEGEGRETEGGYIGPERSMLRGYRARQRRSVFL
jgi:hypothetical protein